jgi:sulfonate transport system permease protein
VAFALLGKASDWLIVGITAPFLRWEDRHHSGAEN